MPTPTYKLAIGKTKLDSSTQPRASTIVELIVNLDMEVAADSFSAVIGHVPGALAAKLHDTATVSLGYTDTTPVQVIAGSVATIEPGIEHTRVSAFTAAQTLLRSYLDQTYETKAAGDIVNDLASKAKVPVANAEAGISFPAYVIDGRRSFSHHINDLAALCGFDSYFNTEGSLVFEKFVKPKAVHRFEYAKDILEVSVVQAAPFAGTVQAWGESPTDTKGEGASAWLTKTFVHSRGISGSGKPVLLLERPALRTKAAAAAAAAADETNIRRNTLRGRLLSPGRPEVKLGDAIQLHGVPQATLNKTFQVRSVKHRITKRGGFTTEIGFRSI
jgi:phage protein D